MRPREVVTLVRGLAVVAPLMACGNDSATTTTADEPILAGTATSRPEVALLANASDAQSCTGALLAPNVVITAAHCVVGSEWAYFGYSKRTRDPNERIASSAPPGVQRRRVVERARMPGFVNGGCPMRGAADVGLLRLDRPVEGVEPAVLGALPAVADECLVVGYGRHNADGSVQSVEATESEYRYNEQRGARVRIAANATVNGQLPGPAWFTARGLDGAHSQGDSGGPLFCNGRIGGIASCSPDRTRSVLELVKVYASVDQAREFVDTTVARWSQRAADAGAVDPSE